MTRACGKSGRLCSARDKSSDARGSSPRNFKNTLVFLAGDANRLRELEQAVRQYLAWSSIWDDRVTLNLDQFQTRVRGGQVEVGPRFSVTNQLDPVRARDPGEFTGGIWEYLYPPRPSTFPAP